MENMRQLVGGRELVDNKTHSILDMMADFHGKV